MPNRFVSRWVIPLAALVLAAGLSSPARAVTNLAQGKLVFASWNGPISGTGVDITANATDNNFTTAWTTAATGTGANSPNAGNDQVGVDLGAAVDFAYVRINWTADHATDFTVEVADTVNTDPTDVFNYGTGDWQVVYTRAADAGYNQANDIISLGPQHHRFVRINGTGSSNTNHMWGLNELQVLDVAPPVVSGQALFGSNGVHDTIVQLDGPLNVPAGGPPTSWQNLKTDASGNFSFPGLYDGTYLIYAVAPGQYAGVSVTGINVSGANVTQNVTFTTAVTNTATNTGPLPAYISDDIANAGEANGGAATASGLVLPSDELPAGPTGDKVWFTGDPTYQIADGTSNTWGMGTKMPATLNFWFPPYAVGQNNVMSATNMVLPVPPAHYSTLYVLQGAADGSYATTAVLNYADGTSQPVVTVGGWGTYNIMDGGSTQDEDEFNAIVVDKRYKSTDGSQNDGIWRVFMRFIPVDSTKVLKNITWGPGFTSNGTLARGFIYGWSGDTLATDTVPATGSISGIVKAPVSEGGGPVKNANVQYATYRITTGTDGAFQFRGLPADTYAISANKPANYPLTTVNVPVAAGASVTKDIQFPYAIPVITDPLTNPNLRQISTDDPNATATDPGFYGDFSATTFGLGSEYLPHGLYSPNTVPDPAPDSIHHHGGTYLNWQHDANAPGALAFDFGNPDITSPVYPGQAGYPPGGTPNTICIHDYELLAPGTNVSNCYLAITGLDGVINLRPVLHYTDGTSETKTVAVSDWFGQPTPNELPYLVMHGRHHFSTNTAGAADYESDSGSTTAAPANIRINALTIPVDSTKVLHDISFDHGDTTQRFPIVSAVSWETTTPQPVSSDIRVTVKKSDGSAAGGAWVVMGPYSTKADNNGVAIFKGVPANKTVDLGAFLYGQTQQGLATGHVVPAGQKMPTPDDVTITLPAAAPVFVQLPLNYNYDMISMSDMVGDYKGAAGNDRSFNGDLMPASNTIIQDPVLTQNIPILMPHKETYYNNVQRLNGQTWVIAPGHYSALTFFVTGQGVGGFPNSVYNHFTMNYADGSSDQVQVANHDWVGNYAAPGTTAIRGFFYREFPPPDPTTVNYVGFNIRSRRSVSDDEQRNENSSTAFVQELVPINANKVLKSITLPYMFSGIGTNDFSILAATLEGNDVQAEATLTGTVVGQPLGESAKGPIAMAQVIADDAHMAYTNPDGTFTLSHVAPGAINLKVVPVGTGILSKTFPVTVAAGANSLGTLDVGVGQTSIYIVLGPTNMENGLHQLEGIYNGYTTDTGRPKNQVNVPDSMTMPVTVGGKQARQSTDTNGSGQYNDYFYFAVDPGWLYHGRIGDPGTMPSSDGTVPGRPARGMGMDLSTFAPPASPPAGGGAAPAGWKVGPHVYMQIEYYDNAKTGQTNASMALNYNQMEGWTHNTAATSWVTAGGVGATIGNLQTIRMTNAYRTPVTLSGDGKSNVNLNIPLGSTNTWKTFVYDLDPVYKTQANAQVVDAFGAYGNENLGADFRINPNYNAGDNPKVIRSIVISLSPTIPQPPQPPSAAQALRFSAGLLTPVTSDFKIDDVTGGTGNTPDGKINMLDAIALARQGLY